MSTIKVGTPAPDFKGGAYVAGQANEKEISLKDYQGK